MTFPAPKNMEKASIRLQEPVKKAGFSSLLFPSVEINLYSLSKR